MGSTDDVIAKTILATYDSLPTKYKPVKATEEFFQWVPLSGIVAIKGTHAYQNTSTLPVNKAKILRIRWRFEAELSCLRVISSILL